MAGILTRSLVILSEAKDLLGMEFERGGCYRRPPRQIARTVCQARAHSCGGVTNA